MPTVTHSLRAFELSTVGFFREGFVRWRSPSVAPCVDDLHFEVPRRTVTADSHDTLASPSPLGSSIIRSPTHHREEIELAIASQEQDLPVMNEIRFTFPGLKLDCPSIWTTSLATTGLCCAGNIHLWRESD